MDFALEANSRVDFVCSSSAAVTVQMIAVFVLPPKLQRKTEINKKIGSVTDNVLWIPPFKTSKFTFINELPIL